MRALVFDGSVSYRPRHPEPAADQGDSVVKVRMAGVCATDLELAKGYMAFQGVLGHEFVGEVESSPERDLVGKRVVGEINVVCGRCDLCVAGLSSHCRQRTVVGIDRHDGCFADQIRLPAVNLHAVPDSVDDESAAFVEPLAAAMQVCKQVTVGPGTWVTVLGDGRLGLLVAQVLRNAGAPVRVVGRHAAKLSLCEKWSIRSRLAGELRLRQDQEVVVECTGSPGGLEMALGMVRPRGTIVLKSTYAAQGVMPSLSKVVVDEVRIVGSRCGPFREAIRALAARQVDVTSMIHRRMKLEQGVEALALAARPGVLKVLVSVQ